MLNRIYGAVFGSPFRGMHRDIKERVPYYWSDWKDGWNYRVVAATVYMYFTNLLPAIAFAQDMFDRTENSYGVNEVLLSSALAGVVFGVFSGQPLCIVGVTGPISIFNATVYELVVPKGIPYFPFMAWICLWSMVMHCIVSVFNWLSPLKVVTRYACDIFGFFICIVYLQKGIQILNRQFDRSEVAGYLSVVIALLLLIFGMLSVIVGNYSTLMWPQVRKFVADYGLPLAVVFFSGFSHFSSRMDKAVIEHLDITKSFAPTMQHRNDGWFIHFWNIKVGHVFLAIPFALLLTILFYFDHNVSSLICQDSQYPLKKPSSFYWDFFLLGITTGVSGLLGIPAPNGLIPQAPLHTISLCVTKYRPIRDDTQEPTPLEPYISEVVEQRVSNTTQGLLILATMTRPLLIVLHQVPKAALAGLFWMMGVTGLMNSVITARLKFALTEKRHQSSSDPLTKCNTRDIYLFLLLELLGFGAEFAILQTRGAIGFPGILMLTVVVGWLVLPRLFDEHTLHLLDGPVASQGTMSSLGLKDSDS